MSLHSAKPSAWAFLPPPPEPSMSHQPLKPPQASRSSKKQQIRQALDKQAQERKPVEFPLPDPPAWKPLG